MKRLKANSGRAAGGAGGGRWWLGRYLAPQWPGLLGGGLAMTGRATVLLLLPWPLKFIIDNVIFQRPLAASVQGFFPDPALHRMALLNELSLLMLALGAADALLVFIGNRLFLDAGQRVVFAIRHDLFAHLQRLSLEFHHRHRGGDLMSRLGGDVQRLQDFIAAIGVDLLPHALTIIGMAAIMIAMDWRYALLALAVAPVLIFVARFYSERLRRALRQVRRHEGDLWGLAQEVMGSVQLVQAYGRGEHEDRRFSEQAGKSLDASLNANGVQSQFGPVMNLVIAIATGAIAWYGAASVIKGTLTPGELLIFLAYLRGLAAPARQLAKTGRVFGRASIAMERIKEYLFEQPSVMDKAGAATPCAGAGLVEFVGVGFGYELNQRVLRDVSFQLEPGKTVALVGATGSGKSTIANLILRFYDPLDGQVRLDGRDLRDLSLKFLRRQVALVLQEPTIFQASVWENISYGREGADREDAIRAARAVGVHDIIERLPGGYDYMISERGLTLSGGQRQCISIARAMLCDAPIVILDEPSSSLDASSEHLIMAALHRLTADRSALIIAHRLQTVMKADLILVLDQGRIVQRGSHRQLLDQSGVYAKLWDALNDRSPARDSQLGELPVS